MQKQATPLRHRDELEIIVDTCSLGGKQLRAMDKLIAYAMAQHPRVFSSYRLVIPIQIATESRQRLFPEFLDAHLRTNPPQELERFYAKHEGHVSLVETDNSLAFKFLYAKKAAGWIHGDTGIRATIIADAKQLATSYHHALGAMPSITEEDFDQFLHRLLGAKIVQESDFEKISLDILKHHSEAGANHQRAEIHLAERKNLAQHGRVFFAQCNEAQKFIMQALYSHRTLHGFISEDPDFSRYRKDKGERAIEDYLFDRREAKNRERVTLVVSEDRGARQSIHKLRNRSHNSIFVVSSWGLARALKELKLIKDVNEVTDRQLLAQVQTRSLDTHLKRTQGHIITTEDVLEPPIEQKWAHRLVEVLQRGEWSKIPPNYAKHYHAGGNGRDTPLR